MTEIESRKVRQNASDLVRRAEAGERFTITMSGRPAAQLGPLEADAWVTWTSVADVFVGPEDPSWKADRDLLDHVARDAWDR